MGGGDYATVKVQLNPSGIASFLLATTICLASQ